MARPVIASRPASLARGRSLVSAPPVFQYASYHPPSVPSRAFRVTPVASIIVLFMAFSVVPPLGLMARPGRRTKPSRSARRMPEMQMQIGCNLADIALAAVTAGDHACLGVVGGAGMDVAAAKPVY